MKHILITGKKNIGKSTLIRKIVGELDCKITGYQTIKGEAKSEKGRFPVYFAPYTVEPPGPDFGEFAGVCGRGSYEIKNEVFNSLGVEYITPKDADLIVMDEIGFMEKGAVEFTDTVINLFKSDVTILAAIKDKPGVPYLEEVKNTPGTVIHTLTQENRDSLAKEILAELRSVLESRKK